MALVGEEHVFHRHAAGLQAGDDLLGLEPGAEVALNEPPGAMITARDFLLDLSYGHFFFHVTTAYDILRHLGVAIGKDDFIGKVRVKIGGKAVDL